MKENRQETERLPPVVLTIAGSDSSGGAGIQVDLKTIHANGGYGVSVITAISAQNTAKVRQVEPVSKDLVRQQLSAVFEDFKVLAIKVGLVPASGILSCILDFFDRHKVGCPIVVDPVISASSGDQLIDSEAVSQLRDELFPRSALITPNVDEASVLAKTEIRSVEDCIECAETLFQRFACSVLIKGGHLEECPGTDVLFIDNKATVLPPQTQYEHTLHGTGCMMASAIATQLAHGRTILESVNTARSFVNSAFASALALGKGQRLAAIGIPI